MIDPVPCGRRAVRSRCIRNHSPVAGPRALTRRWATLVEMPSPRLFGGEVTGATPSTVVVRLASLKPFDGVGRIAVVAAELHSRDRALTGQAVDLRSRYLPALGELHRGEELSCHRAQSPNTRS